MRRLSLFPSSLWGWIRGALSVCLAFMLMHFAITGSPIPLWHLEKLTNPVHVRAISATALVVTDGREIGLPFIKELPKDDLLFRAAVQNGVEVDTNGRVYGLLWMERYCGNDAVYWRREKIDLSELAGAIHPRGLDESQLHPEAIDFLCEKIPRLSVSSNKLRVCRMSDRQGMQLVRNQFMDVSKARGPRN